MSHLVPNSVACVPAGGWGGAPPAASGRRGWGGNGAPERQGWGALPPPQTQQEQERAFFLPQFKGRKSEGVWILAISLLPP